MGADHVFMDVDAIGPGADFVEVIEDAVGSTNVMLIVIGKRWLTAAGSRRRRLDNPDDFVRLVIATALDRNVRVIPVLVQGAEMPSSQNLPFVQPAAGYSERSHSIPR